MTTAPLAPSLTAMQRRLLGRTILITGASSGIGRFTALEFARTAPQDLKLILVARRLEKLRELCEEIRREVGEGVKCFCHAVDVGSEVEVAEFASRLERLADGKEKGFEVGWRVDCLVNNAGLVKGVDRAPDIKPEDITTMINTNLTGLINLTQSVLSLFKNRRAPSNSQQNPNPEPESVENGSGDIINVGSIAGREGYPGGSIYCATKAAVRAFTEALRKELIASRIRVMEIDPGQVETEFSVVRFGGDREKADAVYAGCQPLTPQDIAETIVFMAGRPQNVVIADALVFPSHQAAATVMHRKGT